MPENKRLLGVIFTVAATIRALNSDGTAIPCELPQVGWKLRSKPKLPGMNYRLFLAIVNIPPSGVQQYQAAGGVAWVVGNVITYLVFKRFCPLVQRQDS